MQKIASQQQEEKGLTEKTRARLDDLLNDANSGGEYLKIENAHVIDLVFDPQPSSNINSFKYYQNNGPFEVEGVSSLIKI